jgi:hypothetical protein
MNEMNDKLKAIVVRAVEALALRSEQSIGAQVIITRAVEEAHTAGWDAHDHFLAIQLVGAIRRFDSTIRPNSKIQDPTFSGIAKAMAEQWGGK